MALKFKIDPKEETKEITHLVKNLAGKNILIPILRNNYNKISKEKLYFEIKKLHKGHEKKFSRIKSFYEKSWKKVGKNYIKEMEKIINCKTDLNKTIYFVPSLWVNIADVLGKKNVFIVTEEMQQNPLEFIFLHELTHLHYSDAIHKLNLFHEAGQSPLMEGIDHLILFKSPIKKLFQGIKYEEITFVKSNPKFMKELEKLWNNRKDFESFVIKAIKLNKKTKRVKIC